MINRKKSKSNKLNYQSLERRQLLAGNVTVVLNQDILEVTGDDLTNEIQIVGTANGQARVIAPAGTTINGSAGPFVANIQLRDAVVRLNGGDDVLTVSGLVPQGQLFVEGGAGNDSINISEINVLSLTVDSGDGNDVLQFHNVFSSRNVNIRGQAGNDTVSITAMTSNTLLAIDTAAGADVVAIDNLGIRKAIDLTLGDGDDRVFMTGLVYGYNTRIFLGTGNDTLSVVPQTSSATTTATFWRSLEVNSGEGDDNVFLGPNVESRRKTAIIGAAGNDSSGTSGAMLKSAGFSGVENQQLANLTQALETLYTNLSGQGVDTTPFGRVPVVTPPVLSVNDTALTVPANSAAIVIDNLLTLTANDQTSLTGATVRIGSNVAAEDVLAFVNTSKITHTFDAATGLLTLTGAATAAEYQAALRTVTYDNTRSASVAGTKQITFTINSSSGTATDSRSLTLLGLALPTLSIGSTTPLTVPANSTPLVVGSALTLTGDAATIVSGATISVITHVANQDKLAFVNTAKITGAFNDTTGILTLTGDASLSEYQAALRTITFDNLQNPSVTGTRRVDFSIASNAGNATTSRTLNLEGVPALAFSTSALKVFGGTPATPIDSQLTLVGNSSTNATEARITIAGDVVSENVLAFTNTPKITGVFHAPSATLTLTGNATLAEYQAALRSVTFDNTRTTTLESTRKIDFIVTTSEGPVTASRDVDLGDQLAIRQFATSNNLTTQVTSSGLHFIVDQTGNGTRPTASSRVRVNYAGTFLNGTQFDAGNGVEFSLAQVIRGWTEGIPLFSVGGSGRLFIPSSLAYGAQGQGSIPPNTVLVFDIDLLAII